MSNELTTIDLTSLDAVTGGQNTTQLQVGVQVPTQRGPINLGINGSESESDYARCVRTVAGLPNSTGATIREACGLPPASAPRQEGQ